MIEKLLSHLYRSFGRQSGERVALRVRHPDTFVWSVKDRRLKASTAAGAALADINLLGIDFNGVADALEAAGCQIIFRDLEMAGISADTLIAGGSREDASNGDALWAYTSPLWALLDAYALLLEDADGNIESALENARMHTAADEWLDYWGSHFGIFRGQQVLLGGDLGGIETDEQYLARIVREVLRPRVNKYAIEAAVLDLAGEVVDLYEPWRNVFILSQSELSGDDRIHDGVYWTWNVIQPMIRGSASARDWERILRVIHRNRPIGTIVAEPMWDADAIHETVGEIGSGMFRASVHGIWASILGDAPLSAMVLSDQTFVMNHKAVVHSIHGVSPTPKHSSDTGFRTWTGFWNEKNWYPISGTLVSTNCASMSITAS